MPEPGNADQQAQFPAATALQAKLEQGIALHQQGKLADAERIYREVLRQQPSHFDALHMLGVIALQNRLAERAAELIGRAISQNANVAAAHNNLGKAFLDLKRPEEALASFDRAIDLQPDFPMAYNNRATALLELNRSEEALACFDSAISLKPDFAMPYYNRGDALLRLHRPAEALATCDTAISLEPNVAVAHNNRGDALLRLARSEEALASFDRAIMLEPDFALAHRNRGAALGKLKRFDEALTAYNKAFALGVNVVGVEGERLFVKMSICDWSNWDSESAHLISSVRIGNATTAPFGFLSIPSTSDDQLQCAKSWAALESPPAQEPVWQGERYEHDRIRVAYLSPDFRQHALSYLMLGIFECHDKSRFDVTAISCGPDDSSEIRQRLMASIEHFIDVRTRSEDQIASLVRELEIDIFVDLAGFTLGARTGSFAKRPAPIQVNYLGYPGTMGAQYIDYIVSDKIVIPESQYKCYSEKVVLLPNSYYPTSYQFDDANRSIRTFTRSELGLPPSGFVFCCFNNTPKITPFIFDCWMRILNKVEGSVLWLLQANPKVASNLRTEAVKRGVEAERLIFAKRMPLSEHLARHQQADLFLDTLPYNAHTTASDALWTGVPVLTCLGETFAGRVAASLLSATGLPELITSTLDDYELMAVDLATHSEKLAAIKRKVAENRLTTPLFDTKLFTSHIEAGFTAMYERYQAGLLPDHIIVPN